MGCQKGVFESLMGLYANAAGPADASRRMGSIWLPPGATTQVRGSLTRHGASDGCYASVSGRDPAGQARLLDIHTTVALMHCRIATAYIVTSCVL